MAALRQLVGEYPSLVVCELAERSASLIWLRARNLLDVVFPQCRWQASSPATGQRCASGGQSIITCAADSCPVLIRRFSCARALLISFARSAPVAGRGVRCSSQLPSYVSASGGCFAAQRGTRAGGCFGLGAE